ncbi:MAG: Glu/Leu/Phe/Val dehydrogenase dimerization domain-containing protein [Chitinophagales bacterium]
MSDLLNEYRNKAPEIVFEWHDSETTACGWVVINSLRGGAAGGGTRMRKGLNREEVEALAKIMEIKFSVSGPPIGGAKSGINFDPNDPRKEDVLRRWFKAVSPLLRNYYGTGGDLNVDEVKHVIPMTEDYGIWHPQEGIVNGHFKPSKNKKIHQIGQLRYGVSKVIEDGFYAPLGSSHRYLIADMMTGWGVSESIKHYYDIYRQTTVKDKRVIVQGWGNVAGAAAYYLAQEGAKIVGIIDKNHGLISTEGLDFEAVKALFITRKDNKLPPNAAGVQSFAEVNAKIWDVKADIFIPAAASKLVSQEQAERLLANGLSVVSAGANNPFKDEDLFFGDTAKFVDENCSMIPDFIANCGMARLFAYLMQTDIERSDKALFDDISFIIREALFECYKNSTSKFNLSQTALNIALKKLL